MQPQLQERQSEMRGPYGFRKRFRLDWRDEAATAPARPDRLCFAGGRNSNLMRTTKLWGASTSASQDYHALIAKFGHQDGRQTHRLHQYDLMCVPRKLCGVDTPLIAIMSLVLYVYVSHAGAFLGSPLYFHCEALDSYSATNIRRRSSICWPLKQIVRCVVCWVAHPHSCARCKV